MPKRFAPTSVFPAIIITFIFLFTLFKENALATALKINEFLAHPSTGNHEWVEFYNPDKVDMTGYWLDDDNNFNNDHGSSAKRNLKDITGMNTQYPYVELTSSMFNNSGDAVVLFDPKGQIVDQYTYDKDPGNDISIGRYPDGSGEFVILSSSTRGSANSLPLPSPTFSPVPTARSIISQNAIINTSITLSALPTATNPSSSDSLISSLTPTIFISEIATSSDVLGENSQDITSAPTIKVPVKSTREFNPATIISMLAGVFLLLTCGILGFRRWKSTRDTTDSVED